MMCMYVLLCYVYVCTVYDNIDPSPILVELSANSNVA